MPHICVSKSCHRWFAGSLLLIRLLGKLSRKLEAETYRKMHLKMSSAEKVGHFVPASVCYHTEYQCHCATEFSWVERDNNDPNIRVHKIVIASFGTRWSLSPTRKNQTNGSDNGWFIGNPVKNFQGYKKMNVKLLSAWRWRPFCHDLNVCNNIVSSTWSFAATDNTWVTWVLCCAR